MLLVARRMLLELQADKPWVLHLLNLLHSISPATLCHQGPCCPPFCTFRSFFFPLIPAAPPMRSIPFFLLLLQTFHTAASQLPLFFSPAASVLQLPAVPWAAPRCHSLMRLLALWSFCSFSVHRLTALSLLLQTAAFAVGLC